MTVMTTSYGQRAATGKRETLKYANGGNPHEG